MSIVSIRNSIANRESKHKDRNIGLFHKVVNTTEILFPRAIDGIFLMLVGDRKTILVRWDRALLESNPSTLLRTGSERHTSDR
jgi:hypothetical protein